jgi:hypothetical protein
MNTCYLCNDLITVSIHPRCDCCDHHFCPPCFDDLIDLGLAESDAGNNCEFCPCQEKFCESDDCYTAREMKNLLIQTSFQNMINKITLREKQKEADHQKALGKDFTTLAWEVALLKHELAEEKHCHAICHKALLQWELNSIDDSL